jgi:hypothetical protein
MFLLPMELFSQVRVQFVPEPMVVLSALGAKKFGVWSVMMCSDVDTVVPAEKIYMAAAPIRVIAPNRAMMLLENAKADNPKSVAARWIGIGGAVATGVTGAVKLNPTAVAIVGAGSALAVLLSQRLKDEVPSISQFTDTLLVGPVTLSAGKCATRSVLAGKMPVSQLVTRTVEIMP